MKRWLYLAHRWLGIALAVPMAAWFLSGIVMLYVGYPKLTDAERRAALPALADADCCVPLAAALAAAGTSEAGSGAWRLTSVAGAPRYVFALGARRVAAVDARSGALLGAVGADDAVAAARHFAGGAAGRHLALVDEDAWTHSRALDAHRPLHLVAVDDEARRWLYVSSRTGEVVRDATLGERRWGWFGAWLHWLYMFRGGALDAWWHDLVVWTAIAGAATVLGGLVVGVWRWRWRGRYKSGRRTPYAGFVARWHHLLGLAGGVLAFTWVLSGLLSVNPWRVFDTRAPKPDRAAYAGGPMTADAAPEARAVLRRLRAQGVAAQELEWRRVGGLSHVAALGRGGRWFVMPDGQVATALPPAAWRAAAPRLLPQARIVAAHQLTAYDRYYYAREPHTMGGQRDRPLPVWRLAFDDAAGTWVTIEAASGEIVAVSDRRRRVERWLFAFLHSFDLPQLLAARPAWDAWMIGFSLAGLGLGLTAFVSGWRRLRRARPFARPFARGTRRDNFPTLHQEPMS